MQRVAEIVSEGFTGEKQVFVEDHWARLYEALKRGAILQGKVMGIEKHEGEEALTLFFGPIKGIVPEAEVGANRTRNLAGMVGLTIAFKVLRGDRQAGVVYLSRKEALGEMATATWKELSEAGAELIALRKKLKSNIKRQKALQGRLQEAEKAAAEGSDAEAADEVKGLSETRDRLFAEARELRAAIDKAAPVRTCTVHWVGQAGAIVDIGGVTAYLPAHELGYARVADARDVLKAGAAFDVKVIDLDPETGRVRVSLKSTLPDPWETSVKSLQVGGLYLGKVIGPSPQGKGMLVELREGLRAWVPRLPQDPPEGSAVKIRILSINPSRRTIKGYVTGLPR